MKHLLITVRYAPKRPQILCSVLLKSDMFECAKQLKNESDTKSTATRTLPQCLILEGCAQELYILYCKLSFPLYETSVCCRPWTPTVV